MLRAIGETVGRVIKLDSHLGGARRGHFVRLAVCVNLRKPLVSKVRINGRLQWVEYEGCPNICFKCGYYKHNSESCPREGATSTMVDEYSNIVNKDFGLQRKVEEEPFGSWIVVERRKGRSRSFVEGKSGGSNGISGGLRFVALERSVRNNQEVDM